MAESYLERWGVASLLTVCPLVGSPVVLAQLTVGPAWLWWACYLGFLALLTLTFRDAALERSGRWRPDRRPLVLGVALAGAATVLLVPRSGWTAPWPPRRRC